MAFVAGNIRSDVSGLSDPIRVVYKAKKIDTLKSLSSTMHPWYLLGLFLLFGIDRSSSIGKFSRTDGAADNPMPGETKSFNPITDNSQTSRHSDKLEKAVNMIYYYFFDSPASNLSLRSNQQRKSGLSHSISIIGDSLRMEMKETFKKFGISSPNNERRHTLKSSEPESLKFTVFYELLKMPLELQPIVQQIGSRTKKYLNKNKSANWRDRKMDSFPLPTDRHGSKNQWQNLAISEAVKSYVAHIYKCIEESKGSFDIKRALGKLTNFSPEALGDVIRRRLNKSLPQYLRIRKSEHTQMQASFCQAIVDNLRTDYVKCLAKIKLIEKCVNEKFNGSSSMDADGSVGKSSADLIKTVKSLDPTCTNYRGEIGFFVNCRESQKMVKSNEFSYVTEFLLGDLKKSPVINRMANELVSTVQKTEIGSHAIREIATLMSVHQHAEEQMAKFPKTSGKNSKNKISQKLADYKRNLASMGLKTLKNVNEVISDVEQIFVDSKLKVSPQDLSPNVKVLRCFGDFMESIFNGYWLHKHRDRKHGNNTDETTSPAKRSASGALLDVRHEVGFLKDSHDKSFNEWADSMKHLSKSSSTLRRSSALVSIARTFLLATMFYECIALLAGVLYREDSEPMYQNYGGANYVNDAWMGADEQSFLPTNIDDRTFRYDD